MGVITIENAQLRVGIKSMGAELCSLVDKTEGIEHMWKADPKFWPRHAPILFPCVGESKDGRINVGGIDYPMGRHGFARLQEFQLLETNDSNATFRSVANDATKASYPFEFELIVTYSLHESSLTQRFAVKNLGQTSLGFQLGGHPAFSVPFNATESFDDYEIRFDSTQTLYRHLLAPNGLYSGEKRLMVDNDDGFRLSYDLFMEDALVFKDIVSKRVSIQHKDGGKKLVLNFDGFPHLGIWSLPGADYVCLEPWIGCADTVHQPKDFFQKDSIVQLGAGQSFYAGFSVSLVS